MGIISYIKETKGEMKHVSWPTRQQATVLTVLIILISFLLAAYLGGLDWVFTHIVELFV